MMRRIRHQDAVAPWPGRDRRAVRHPGPAGAPCVPEDRTVTVVGGGIAGMAAATVLAERGVHVNLLEGGDRLGGRVAAWPVDRERTMGRGFHAFFRQYYNLRALLRRADPGLTRLRPIADYPLQRPDGLRDSFARIPRTPPFSVLGFVLRSPSFTAGSLARVNVPAALELVRVRFPESFAHYDGESASAFLDRLRFPSKARDLALEVFARSFFAHPDDFSAGELVAMFHAYFVGSAEGLLFDVPDDDFDTALWSPLHRHLDDLGVDVRTDSTVISLGPGGVRLVDGTQIAGDAVVLATDPTSARTLVDGLDRTPGIEAWRRRVRATRTAPPFVVVRLWLDGLVAPQRPAFLGTSGYGPLDNVSVLERFEAGAARWSAEHGGSVVELHAYACSDAVADSPGTTADAGALDALVTELETQLHRVQPETAGLTVLHREVRVGRDCPLVDTSPWRERPGVSTPLPWLVLAGDWVRCDHPVALMERAATTGILAANELLQSWGAAGEDVWTVPTRGLLARRGAPGSA